MTQEERWQAQYDQMMAFMEENHRRPSKYKLEEHDMLNWFKSNKKMMNKGIFPEERLERFNKLLELAEKYRRLNQHDIKGNAITNGFIERLVLKAMEEIPKIPKESWKIEHYRVSENVRMGGNSYVFSLNCSPPLKEDSNKAMMVRCEVSQPSKCLALTVPIMEKTISEVLLSLQDDAVKLELKKSFEYLMEEMSI